MPDDEPVYYPDVACHLAPLRPGDTPRVGCDCRVCRWARNRARSESFMHGMAGPVRPGTPAWETLMELAK